MAAESMAAAAFAGGDFGGGETVESGIGCMTATLTVPGGFEQGVMQLEIMAAAAPAIITANTSCCFMNAPAVLGECILGTAHMQLEGARLHVATSILVWMP